MGIFRALARLFLRGTPTTSALPQGSPHPPSHGEYTTDDDVDADGYRSPLLAPPPVPLTAPAPAMEEVYAPHAERVRQRGGLASAAAGATDVPPPAAAEGLDEDDGVVDFLDSIIAGNTDQLRKEMAKHTLASVVAAANAVSNSSVAANSSMHGSLRRRPAAAEIASGEERSSAGDTGASENEADKSQDQSEGVSTSDGDGRPRGSPRAQQQQQQQRYVSSAARSLQDYELVAYIGSGTFAEVTLARHKTTHELFAIKKISKAKVKEEGCVERTFTERQLLASLRHPFLVRLHRAFQSRTHLYFVLDLAQGGDLYYFNQEKLWVRDVKRTLKKLRYPFYISWNADLALRRRLAARGAASGEGRALRGDGKGSSGTSSAGVTNSGGRRAPVSGRTVGISSDMAYAESSLWARSSRSPASTSLTGELVAAAASARGANRGHTQDRHADGGGRSSAGSAPSPSPAQASSDLVNDPTGEGQGSTRATVAATTESPTTTTTTTDAAWSRLGPPCSPRRPRAPSREASGTTTAPTPAQEGAHSRPAASTSLTTPPPLYPTTVAATAKAGGAAVQVESPRLFDAVTEEETDMDDGTATDTLIGSEAGGFSFPSRRALLRRAQAAGLVDARGVVLGDGVRGGGMSFAQYYTTDAVDEFADNLSDRDAGPAAAAAVGGEAGEAEARRGAREGVEGTDGGEIPHLSPTPSRRVSADDSPAPKKPAGRGVGGRGRGAARELRRLSLYNVAQSERGSRSDASTDEEVEAGVGGGGGGAAHGARTRRRSSGPHRRPGTAEVLPASGDRVTSGRRRSSHERSGGTRNRNSPRRGPRVGSSATDDGDRPPRARSLSAHPPTTTTTTATVGTTAVVGHELSPAVSPPREQVEGHSVATEGRRARHRHRDGSGAHTDVEGLQAGREEASVSSARGRHRRGLRTVRSAAELKDGGESQGAARTRSRTPGGVSAEERHRGGAAVDSAAGVRATGRAATVSPAASPAKRGSSPASSIPGKRLSAKVDVNAEYVPSRMDDSTVTCPTFAADGSRVPIRLVAFYAVEIALVLQYLHGNGFIYRDLKPENVLMRRSGHVMLTDFGVAKFRKGAIIGKAASLLPRKAEAGDGGAGGAGGGTTMSGDGGGDRTTSFTGTPQYMSPEMLQGLPHDSRTDWWSYGCLLFEWANGRKAFEAPGQFALFRSIVEEDVRVREGDDFTLTALETHARVAQLHCSHQELLREQEGQRYRAQQLLQQQQQHQNHQLGEGDEGERGTGARTVPGPAEETDRGTPPTRGPSTRAGDGADESFADSASAHVVLAQSFPYVHGHRDTNSPSANNSENGSTSVRPEFVVRGGAGAASASAAAAAAVGGGGGTCMDTTPSFVALSATSASRAMYTGAATPGSRADTAAPSARPSVCVTPVSHPTAMAGAGGGAGGDDGPLRPPDVLGFGGGRSLDNASFVSIAGSPVNASFQYFVPEAGAAVEAARPITCDCLTPADRDVFLRYAMAQMDEANALLHDLISQLLRRDMESRLSGAAVLEHPFFSCPYVVSQLYHAPHPSTMRTADNASFTARTLTGAGPALGAGESTGSDRVGRGWAGGEALVERVGDPAAGSTTGQAGAHPAEAFLQSLPPVVRPADWAEGFLTMRIHPPYVPRLRTFDDLRYFPSAVTATGLSAAVEQQKRIRAAKEQKRERQRQAMVDAAAARTGGGSPATEAVRRHRRTRDSPAPAENMSFSHMPATPGAAPVWNHSFDTATERSLQRAEGRHRAGRQTRSDAVARAHRRATEVAGDAVEAASPTATPPTPASPPDPASTRELLLLSDRPTAGDPATDMTERTTVAAAAVAEPAEVHVDAAEGDGAFVDTFHTQLSGGDSILDDHLSDSRPLAPGGTHARQATLSMFDDSSSLARTPDSKAGEGVARAHSDDGLPDSSPPDSDARTAWRTRKPTAHGHTLDWDMMDGADSARRRTLAPDEAELAARAVQPLSLSLSLSAGSLEPRGVALELPPVTVTSATVTSPTAAGPTTSAAGASSRLGTTGGSRGSSAIWKESGGDYDDHEAGQARGGHPLHLDDDDTAAELLLARTAVLPQAFVQAALAAAAAAAADATQYEEGVGDAGVEEGAGGAELDACCAAFIDSYARREGVDGLEASERSGAAVLEFTRGPASGPDGDTTAAARRTKQRPAPVSYYEQDALEEEEDHTAYPVLDAHPHSSAHTDVELAQQEQQQHKGDVEEADASPRPSARTARSPISPPMLSATGGGTGDGFAPSEDGLALGTPDAAPHSTTHMDPPPHLDPLLAPPLALKVGVEEGEGMERQPAWNGGGATDAPAPASPATSSTTARSHVGSSVGVGSGYDEDDEGGRVPVVHNIAGGPHPVLSGGAVAASAALSHTSPSDSASLQSGGSSAGSGSGRAIDHDHHLRSESDEGAEDDTATLEDEESSTLVSTTSSTSSSSSSCSSSDLLLGEAGVPPGGTWLRTGPGGGGPELSAGSPHGSPLAVGHPYDLGGYGRDGEGRRAETRPRASPPQQQQQQQQQSETATAGEEMTTLASLPTLESTRSEFYPTLSTLAGVAYDVEDEQLPAAPRRGGRRRGGAAGSARRTPQPQQQQPSQQQELPAAGLAVPPPATSTPAPAAGPLRRRPSASASASAPRARVDGLGESMSWASRPRHPVPLDENEQVGETAAWGGARALPPTLPAVLSSEQPQQPSPPPPPHQPSFASAAVTHGPARAPRPASVFTTTDTRRRPTEAVVSTPLSDVSSASSWYSPTGSQPGPGRRAGYGHASGGGGLPTAATALPPQQQQPSPPPPPMPPQPYAAGATRGYGYAGLGRGLSGSGGGGAPGNPEFLGFTFDPGHAGGENFLGASEGITDYFGQGNSNHFNSSSSTSGSSHYHYNFN